MINSQESLVDAAKKAGIHIPPDLRDYDKLLFPYWDLLCLAQLERPLLTQTSHYDNAKMISKIPVEQIGKISFGEIKDKLL